MVSKKIVNFHVTPTNNTYEQCFFVDSAAEAAILEERFIQKTGIEIWTGPGKTLVQLSEGTDYGFFEINSYATNRVGSTVYTELRILNATYHGIPLYIPAGVMLMHGDFYDEIDINSEHDARGNIDRIFHNKSESRGLIIPLYIYPSSIYTNDTYNSIIEIKKQYPSVPVIAVLNPSSGPGTVQDGNYYRAIRRLQGADIICIGYISTSWSTRDQALVRRDLIYWKRLYPEIQGIFYDEMTYSDTASEVEYYRNVGQAARDMGYQLIVNNPGAAFAHDYFDENVADIIVGWENSTFPTSTQAKEDWADGIYEYSKLRRALLIHSQSSGYNYSEVNRILADFGWIWITQDMLSPNPWDNFSEYYIKMLNHVNNYNVMRNDPEGEIKGAVSINHPDITQNIGPASTWTVPKGKYNIYGLSASVRFEETINTVTYQGTTNGAYFSDGVNCQINNTTGGAVNVYLKEY